MINFKKFEMLYASREEWNSLHQFRKQFSQEEDPDEPLIENHSFEELQKNHIVNNKLRYRHFSIFDGVKQIGFFGYTFFDKDSPSFKGNERIIKCNIELLKQYRNQGIATNFLKDLVQYAKQNDKNLFTFETTIPSSKGFFTAIGAKIVQIHFESKLLISSIKMDKLQDWIKEAEEMNPDTKIFFFEGPLPDKFVEPFAVAFTNVYNDQPNDDLEVGEEVVTVEMIRKDEKIYNQTGIKVLTVSTIEKSGEISSLSVVHLIPGFEKILSQRFTGVQNKFRNKKLGKWVKAFMILNILDKYPEIEAIITGNAESNGPMLHINNILGYKKYKERYFSQITLDQLELYIKSKDITIPK